MAGYMTYWSKEYIRGLKKAGDNGALSVIFGSHHTKMPSIASVKVGDVIYPVTLADGRLCVMAKLPVEKIEAAFDYLMRETGGIHGALAPDDLAIRQMKEKPHKFHQEPQTCCAKLAASGTQGSGIEARPLPLEVIPDLRFGPVRSKQKPLRLDKNGIPTIVSLSGAVCRMSEETQAIFESVFSDE